MQALNQLLVAIKIEANVYHNGQYCGLWALDTSGSEKISFHVVTKGKCHLKIGNESIELREGDAIFFPTDASHQASNDIALDLPVNQAESLPMTKDLQEESTGLVCGNFGHDNPIFEKLLKQLPNYILIRASENSASSNVINMMIEESKQTDQNTSLLLNRLSDCLFFMLLRDHVDTQSGLFTAMTHPKLGKSLDLIHSVTDKSLSLDDLAGEAGMSRSSFSSLFKEFVGQSPIEYITQWRMTQAYRWLADEGISTLTAALRSGYESEASFSKAFKRAMGATPGLIRNKSIST